MIWNDYLPNIRISIYPDDSKTKNKRYWLERHGKHSNPIYCLGINPSKADKIECDETLLRVDTIVNAQKDINGNKISDSWVMLNLWPIYQPDSKKLDFGQNNEFVNICEDNVLEIDKKVKNNSIVWIAFGSEIKRRKRLKECFINIYNVLKRKNIEWICRGTSEQYFPLFPYQRGESREICRNIIFESFDIDKFCELNIKPYLRF